MPYPYLEIPLRGEEGVWIHASAYKDDHYNFHLEDDDLNLNELLLLLGLARRGDNLGYLTVEVPGITFGENEQNGWLSFLNASNSIQTLNQSLERHRHAFIAQRPRLANVLRQSLLENRGDEWRLRWDCQQICFAPSAFRGSFRLKTPRDCNSGGELTIEMNEISNNILTFAPQQLYRGPATQAVGRALFFMNMNPIEIGAPYVFRSSVDEFCIEIYNLLGGNYHAQRDELRNDPILLLNQIPRPEQIRTHEDKIFNIYTEYLGVDRECEIYRQFGQGLNMIEGANVPWFITELKNTVRQNFREAFAQWWEDYASLARDIIRLVIAIYNADMAFLLQGGALSAAILKRNCNPVIQYLMRGVRAPLTFDAVAMKRRQMLNNPSAERFRTTLSHDKLVQGIRQWGCFNFYSNIVYGNGGLAWYLYYLIDFKLYGDRDQECILPFYTESNRERSLTPPDGFQALSAAGYYAYV
jgi:hypothetical protein